MMSGINRGEENFEHWSKVWDRVCVHVCVWGHVHKCSSLRTFALWKFDHLLYCRYAILNLQAAAYLYLVKVICIEFECFDLEHTVHLHATFHT